MISTLLFSTKPFFKLDQICRKVITKHKIPQYD